MMDRFAGCDAGRRGPRSPEAGEGEKRMRETRLAAWITRRSLAAGAMIAGLAMVIAACGQSGGQTPTGAAQPAAQPATAGQAQGGSAAGQPAASAADLRRL